MRRGSTKQNLTVCAEIVQMTSWQGEGETQAGPDD